MPYTDPADLAAWRQRNRDKQRQYNHKHYHGGAGKEQQLAARAQTKERQRLKDEVKALGLGRVRVVVAMNGRTKAYPSVISKRWRDKLKVEAHAILGGCCKVCGMDVPECLHVDHIHPLHQGLDKAERKARHRGSSTTFREVRDHKHPHTEFQLLCANCHAIKTHVNGEYNGDYLSEFA